MPCLQICKSGPIAQEVGCTLFYKAEKEPKMVEFPRTEMICPWRNPYHVFSVDLHPYFAVAGSIPPSSKPHTFACDAVAVFFNPMQILVDQISFSVHCFNI